MHNSPFEVELEPGKKYYWCTCGLSENQPYCDGAHKGSGLKSLHFYVESPVESSRESAVGLSGDEATILPIETEKTVYATLCGCKKTKTPPYCDGTHRASEDMLI